MTSNTSGVYPIDPTTPQGYFRSELGDVVASNISGSVADYEFVSDAYINALIAAYPTMPDMAIGKAMISIANQMIAAAQNIQVSDIKINSMQRAQIMLDAANARIANAIEIDASTAWSVVALSAKSDYHNYWAQGQPYNELQMNGQPGIIGASGF